VSRRALADALRDQPEIETAAYWTSRMKYLLTGIASPLPVPQLGEPCVGYVATTDDRFPLLWFDTSEEPSIDCGPGPVPEREEKTRCQPTGSLFLS
jgi:hypothetical protein